MQAVETFDTEQVPAKMIASFVSDLIDTSVKGILDRLRLQVPIHLPTASYGHFSRPGFSWEEVVG